ncbi:amidinotransferase [Candidatus Saccharibacteria bacterium]|nr:MAG: amidinotransferase [Candidatus Saccharibacteria bacterium]
MHTSINTTVLMSDAEYFDDGYAINPFMGGSEQVNISQAISEHNLLTNTLKQIGVAVLQVPAPPRLQDGVYTANWGLVRGDKAVLSSLPTSRQGEQPYAKQALENLGKTIYEVPRGLKFSGQGDALPCGNYLFCGSGYRTDSEVHPFLAETLGYETITLQTIPLLDAGGKPAANAISGWADSYFYDLDLALAVLKFPADNQKGLIAWCPDAFLPESRDRLREFDGVDKIEVSFTEAKEAFACNLVSTGSYVVMSASAPNLRAAIDVHGLQTIPLAMPQLAKGGGFIRCTTLTLDNI